MSNNIAKHVLKNASKLRIYQVCPCQKSRREYQCGTWQKMVHWWKFTRVATWPHLTPRNWVIPNKSANSYRESMTWWGGLDLVFLNLFRTWFHVEIYDSDVFCFVESNHPPKNGGQKSQPVVFWRSFFLRNMVCFFFLGPGGIVGQKNEGSEVSIHDSSCLVDWWSC